MKSAIRIQNNQNWSFTFTKWLELDNCNQLLGTVTLSIVSFYHQQPQLFPAQSQRSSSHPPPLLQSPQGSSALRSWQVCGESQRCSLAKGRATTEATVGDICLPPSQRLVACSHHPHCTSSETHTITGVESKEEVDCWGTFQMSSPLHSGSILNT